MSLSDPYIDPTRQLIEKIETYIQNLLTLS